MDGSAPALEGEPAFLPYGRHVIEEDDILAVAAVLRSDFLTGGPAVAAFEAAFAQAVGAAYAVVVANGTAALHLGALALGLGPGDHVVVPSVTFLATANAARYVGAEVVFADVDPATGLMGPAEVEAAIARSPGPVKAVFPVHLAGQCVDLATIAGIAERHGIAVMDDACHALGSRFTSNGRDHRAGDGTLTRLSTFSMHPVKTIAMGEGGALTTSDAGLARRLGLLRSHGMVRAPGPFAVPEQALDSAGGPNPWYYEMPEPGFNFRESDIHCALGLSQLGKLDRFVSARARLVATYDRLLPALAPVVQPLARLPGQDPAWHLMVVRIDFAGAGIERATVMRALQARGIGSQVHYLPVHRQPYYRDRYGNQVLPGADAYYDTALSLPLFPTMGEDDVARVVAALAAVLGLQQ
ncbi:UDP-4-amino-4,6-dideoxy-N-acetyl-beta-L-altrosamine transaminase [Zavarzinia sp. CC-PAN008]|uniref:UDP-4-amino-4, 6-dideoxy-N-acetyl-beta-L-altrosamine transaminase n=1 Tax=Zavarzinia sp. CC-PAN008 TaxID=3243332 RepID=UPI003F7466FC